MKNNAIFSDEEMDYLGEMFNVGSGNAVTALCRLLKCEVEMKQPQIKVLPAARWIGLIGDASESFACLRMDLAGDVTGNLFFMVADAQKAELAGLADRYRGPIWETSDPKAILGTLSELANILAGVYLTAIYEFCELNIYHSVPFMAVETLQTILDETNAALDLAGHAVILITNEFVISSKRFKTFFVILPRVNAAAILIDSMKAAVNVQTRTHN
jgi:chemotaxis protein CheC